MDDEMEITGSKTGKDNGKRKQLSLDKFFRGPVPMKKSSAVSQTKPGNSSTNSTSRALKIATANRWKTNDLAKFMADQWLLFRTKKDHVLSMSCKCCTTYIDKINSCKNFRAEWASSGCTRLMLDSARNHAESDQHKLSWELFLKDEGLDLQTRSGISKHADASQAVIIEGLQKMSEAERASMLKKIEIAHFVTYEEMAFTKYKKLVKLEERHGVSLGESYGGDDACKHFVRGINGAMEDKLKMKLDEAKFVGIMADGSTDAAVKDQEAIFAFYFDPKPVNEERVKVVTTFVGIIDGKDTDAPGILKSIDQAFESIGGMDANDVRKKTVAFGADGASVNRGEDNGVISLIQDTSPWVIFLWCIAHRLELSLKDALADTCFKHIDELLLNIYLLYYKSPKKLRQLKEFADLYSQSLERTSSGKVRPKNAKGTRWIGHKWNAMRNIFANYGVYMGHIEKMTVDKSYTSKERAKFVGYLKKWKHAKTPLYLALFIELLSPARILSLAFQSEEVDIVNTSANIEKSKRMLEKLRNTPVFELPKVKSFFDQVNEDEDGKKVFQGVKLTHYDNAVDSIEDLKDALSSLIKNAIQERLEDDSDDLISKAATILNTIGWDINKLSFADQEISELYDHFETPLRNAGFNGDKDDLLEQWHDLIEYSLKYLSPSSTEYHQCWYKIFNTTMSKNWELPLILVCLLFTLPVSNAAVERLFSLMKRLKTSVRSVLGNDLLNASIRICNGPPPDSFDPTSSLKKFMEIKNRRPKQRKRAPYKPRRKEKQVETLMDILSDEEDMEEEDEEEEHSDGDIDTTFDDVIDYEE